MIEKLFGAFFPGFSWRHGFVLWGVETLVGAGVSLVGGMMGDDAADDAADAQSASAGQAIAELRQIGDRTRKDTTPYRNMGIGAANKLSYLLGFGSKTDKYTMDDFANYNSSFAPSWYQDEGPQGADAGQQYDSYLAALSSGRAANLGPDILYQNDDLTNHGFRELNDYSGMKYGGLLDSFTEEDLAKDVVYNKGLEFGLNEGNKAIERNATRFGNLDSGATLKALTRFGNDYGETKAAGAQQRFMGDKAFNINALLGATGVGQWGVGLDANTGSQMAQAIGNAQMGAGNAQAAGIMGGANAWSDAFTGLGNSLGGSSRGGSFGSIFGGKTPSYVPEYAGGGIDLSRYFA